MARNLPNHLIFSLYYNNDVASKLTYVFSFWSLVSRLFYYEKINLDD